MNILIVNKYFFVSGGPERYMFSVIQALESDGHKVVPLALKLDQNCESPYSRYFLKSPFGPSTAKFGEAKLSVLQTTKLAGRTLYYRTARRTVAQIIEQEQIDVVYLLNICNYIGPSVIAAARDKSVRVVMRLSDFNFICASYNFQRKGMVCLACKKNLINAIRYRCVNGSLLQSSLRSFAIKVHKLSGIYNYVSAFVCPSGFMGMQLVDFGLPSKRVHVLPSFIDVGKFENHCLTSGKFVLYFGRLSSEKGVDILLRAWNLLGNSAPQLRIVGSGDENTGLQRLSSRLGLNTVIFEPFLGQKEVMKRLGESLFVVVPSVCPDNSPMAVFESMAMGKAVIASRLGGLVDQVDEGSTGILVPPGDTMALANAVMTLVNDPKRLSAMGKSARFRAEHIFSQREHMNKLLDIFHGSLYGAQLFKS